jgi:hypothetical protein
MTQQEPAPSPAKVGLRHLLQSVLAAALGVQSAKNRERDFQQGSAGVFIAAGLIFTVLFIGGVVAVVQMVIASQ